MQIDFHHTVTYLMARLAGFPHEEAAIIGHSAQYVDDATGQGPIYFNNKAMYDRICSAHKMLDYRNFRILANHHVWIPFHFLPSGESRGERPGSTEDFLDRLVCRPNSAVAQDLVATCIRDQHEPWILHRLGICMHAYADTWAHQGFLGIDSPRNEVNDILDFSGLSDAQKNKYVARYFRGSWWEIAWSRITSWLVEEISPVGHGAVLSFPDRPYLQWRYRDWRDQEIIRDNPKDFLLAAQHVYESLYRFRQRDPKAVAPPLAEAVIHEIDANFRNFTEEDGGFRHQRWLKALAQGCCGLEGVTLDYAEVGANSWKEKALGTSAETPASGTEAVWTPDFPFSDWKLFHDALQRHRQVVLNEVLPRFGIIAA